MPTSVVKEILTQPDPQGRRGKGIAIFIEYDLEIKPAKLVKGQGLAKIMAHSNYYSLILHMIAEFSTEEQEPQGHSGPSIGEYFLLSPWYTDVIFILQHV